MSDATECWLPIPGWEGLYEVSDLGRVRSVDRRTGGNRWARGRILKPGSKKSGHLHVNLWSNNHGGSHQVHALVMEAFVGPRPAGMQIRHLDGDPTNNRLSNLRYGTCSENRYDTTRHGRNHHANKTHCDNGHEFSPENTQILYRPDGRFKGRACITCVRRTKREWARSKRARDREKAA